MNVYPFTRHRVGCLHRGDGQWRKCSCPKWLYWHQDGKMHRVSAKTRKWDAALDYAREIESRLRASMLPESATVEHALNAFIADKKAQLLRPETISKLRTFAKQLLTWCSANQVISVADLDINRLRAWRSTWNVKAHTARKRQERLVALLQFCVSSGWVRENPAKELSRIKVDQKPTDCFTDSEMNTIIAATYEMEGGERVRVLAELMRWSGLSIQDAVTLERSRLNEDDQIMLYRQKTGVPVFVTLPPDVAALLREHKNDNPDYFLWSGNGSKKSAVSSYSRSLRRLFKKSALKKRCHSHMFRDTFAVNLLLCGVALHDVAILLGHESIKTTERHYAPFVLARQEQLSDAVRMAWGRAAWNHRNSEAASR